jgi:hypothetical protein
MISRGASISLLALLLAAVGCDSTVRDGTNLAKPTKNVGEYTAYGSGTTIQEIDVDGCQYLIADKTTAVSIIHKANCKNPEHKPHGATP